MIITENKLVTREIYVAHCIRCDNAEIRLSHCNYSSFNYGGGTCENCGYRVYGAVDCNPSIDHLASIWNAKNDISILIGNELDKIAESNKKIQELRSLK